MWGAIQKRNKLAFDKRWTALFIVTIGLYIAIVGLAITTTAQHSSDLATDRTRQSVEIALRNTIDDLASRAQDFSQSANVASIVHSKSLTKDNPFTQLREQSAQGRWFTGVALVDSDWNQIFGISRGVSSTQDERLRLQNLLKTYKSALSGSRETVSGYVSSEGQIYAFAKSRIDPPSALAGKDPIFAVFTKQISQQEMSKIGSGLQLPTLDLVPASDSANSAKIFDLLKKPIAAAKWPTSVSRWEALLRILPWLSLLMAVNVGLSGHLIRTGVRRVIDLGTQANFDALSGLANRRGLRDALADAAYNHETVALALIDLDGFKQVNDTYGHDVGDALIKIAADSIASSNDDGALPVRLGGDEFALLVRGEDVALRIEAMAQDMIQRMRQTVKIGARSLQVSASIGLTVVDLSEVDPLEAMRRADVAMYASKRAGKRCYTWFEENHDKAQAEEKAIARDMQTAIHAGEFSVVYQPVHTAQNRTIVGVEALLRWNSASRGHVAPSVFIPIADKTGLITPLSHQLLILTAQDRVQWGDTRIAFNMTAAHMRQTDFIESLKASITVAGILPEYIEIEMSESLYLADRDRVISISKQLAELGISLTLDDFGSGATALNALREGGFSAVKLDRELVRQAEHDAVALALLQSGIAVAHALEMIVIAEGVETEAQAELMTVAGCDRLQGWLFGQAVNGQEMSELMIEQKRERKVA